MNARIRLMILCSLRSFLLALKILSRSNIKVSNTMNADRNPIIKYKNFIFRV